MERIIEIKGRVGLYDLPSFTYADNESLVIRFKTKKPTQGRYVATATCGKQKKTVYLGDDMSLELLPEFIREGEYSDVYISLEFRNQQGDNVYISGNPEEGGFLIEPLHIERVGEYTSAQGWIAAIEAAFKEVYGRLDAAEEKLKNFEDEGVPVLVEADEDQNKEIIEGDENHEEN